MAGWVLHPGYGFDAEMRSDRPGIATAFPDAHGHLVSEVPAGVTVVPRFRALPFGRELADDVAARGSTLVNTPAQHRFAADLGQWYPVFEDLTPRTWPDPIHVPPTLDGPFVVKGETNSRRQLWSTHCFARTRGDIGAVVANLTADSMIGHQRIYIREYVELVRYATDVVGMPITDEYRVFFLDGTELTRGYYWVNFAEELASAGITPDPKTVPGDFVAEIGGRLEPHIRFAAIDVARTVAGDWIVVEVNDGSMAGVCGVDARCLYASLAARL